MDTAFSNEDLKFQSEIRDFIKTNYPQELRDSINSKRKLGKELSREDLTAWHKILGKHNGWSAPSWPKQYGGAEFTPTQKYIFEQECAKAECQYIMPFGINMVGPVIYTFGNEEQKAQHLPGILSGEVFWCQGYSEPGSGSDLASLQTKAIVDGDDFIINGQKIWTSGAQIADMMFCLVRTEPEATKHKGISYILIDMKTPGIEVRPLMTMTGHAEFNEVFFTDVRVPKKQIVGKRGEGWYVANATLTHERGMLGDPNQSATRLNEIIDLMHQETINGEKLINNPIHLDRLMKLQARVLSMSFNSLRLLTASHKKLDAKMAKLIVKLNGCQLNHDLAGFAIDLLGELGTIYGKSNHDHGSGKWQWKYMFDLGLIIGGGTAQIQKNIISEIGLGMPREPKSMVDGKK